MSSDNPKLKIQFTDVFKRQVRDLAKFYSEKQGSLHFINAVYRIGDRAIYGLVSINHHLPRQL